MSKNQIKLTGTGTLNRLGHGLEGLYSHTNSTSSSTECAFFLEELKSLKRLLSGDRTLEIRPDLKGGDSDLFLHFLFRLYEETVFSLLADVSSSESDREMMNSLPHLITTP